MTSKEEETKTLTSKEDETKTSTSNEEETINPPETETPTSVSTPPVFVTICSSDELKVAMKSLDIEVICTAEKVDLISEYDLFGYESKGIYEKIYSLCQEGSGSAFHLWEDNHGVVFLGSEGERAKVSQTCEDFLQIACSLAPHFMDAISSLPALNTLPDNGDISAAKEEDFEMEKLVENIDQWLKDDPKPELCEAADQILSAINLPRLNIQQALKKMIDAHLKEPRFSMFPEDDDEECVPFDYLVSSDEEED
mmetsp:Transcript_27970/g.31976  ORF Transcript_27970/g.31976 Transcript_27970/m.31976 type:complete len:253 (+) Transcript_27970:80-838(+)|eukprot:CAMPEP_0194136578 /NCGR_PEP_ID=MMETSP0152-20130528/6587_1 /TAXON_ID=1049557 /ORGANISM="Thalassiothrix antarctica, Strain L6-D1" /LENGTH=252 /DNA_ID=CAMNT_0038833295 /DNA_START=37 /DNA_END=795 /DNA_ORIENTATION=-